MIRTILLTCAAMFCTTTIAQDFNMRTEMPKGVLGVTLSDSGDDDGVTINRVLPRSPAADAGLKDGTVLLAVNGNKVRSARQVAETLRNFNPGDEVTLKVAREQGDEDVTVVMGSPTPFQGHFLPKAPKASRWLEFADERRNYAGITMTGLGEQLAAYFGVTGGVLVEEVVPDSPAQRAGLAAGDVITRWGDDTVASTSDLHKALAASTPGDAVELIVVRRGEEQVLSLIPEEREGAAFFQARPLIAGPALKSVQGLLPHLHDQLQDAGEMERMREDLDALRKELEALKKDRKD